MEMFDNAIETYFGSRYEDMRRFKDECFNEGQQA